jgi:hypothetical protein
MPRRLLSELCMGLCSGTEGPFGKKDVPLLSSAKVCGQWADEVTVWKRFPEKTT